MKKLLLLTVVLTFSSFLTFGQVVQCKTFLQGAYQGGSVMNTAINGLITGTQPYDVSPWNYTGSETISSIPVNMVDWVLIELRDPGDLTSSVAKRAAILLNDGNIADTNLNLTVDFAGVIPGNYFICIYHRNHLPVMSANPVAVPNAVAYDFSDTLNFPPYGGGSNALIKLEPGIFGMIAGDANKDGKIQYSGPNNDRAVILQYILNNTGSTSITATVSAYTEEDVNMDSIVKYSGPNNDPSIIIQNIVVLTGSTSITKVFKSPVPDKFQCGDSLFDSRDGNTYNTVQIGTQCWMAENLAFLPSVSPSSSGSYTTPYYYVYGYQGTNVNDAKATSNYQTYGVLYNWPAAMAGQASSNSVPSGVQGICPSGWHLPSDEEWKMLEGEVDSQYGYPDPEWNDWGWRGTDAGGNLKETGTTHWNSPNTGATNSSGFTALPGGRRYGNGSFYHLGLFALFWSSTEYSSSDAWDRYLYGSNADVARGISHKERGFSLRCCKDNCTPQPTQSNAGVDSLNIAGDSIALMANTPVNGQGLWTITSGTNGSFADSTNPTTMFYGLPGNTYNLVWTISNNCGSSSDTVVIGFASQGITCGSPFTDSRDGNTYNTVQIGTQCWMAENLNYATSNSWCYNNNSANCNVYGRLYTWPAAMAGQASSNSVPSGVQGICPSGWHLPSDEEWKILEGEVDSQYGYPDPEWNDWGWRGTDAGGNLKETGTTHWNSPNTGATNSSGFLALPGGYRFNFDYFIGLGGNADFWSSTEYSTSNAWSRDLGYDHAGVHRYGYYKDYGFSVRCLRDY